MVVYFKTKNRKKNRIGIEVNGWGAWGAGVLRPYMIVLDGSLSVHGIDRKKQGWRKPAPTWPGLRSMFGASRCISTPNAVQAFSWW
jgi:hypothetical protein